MLTWEGRISVFRFVCWPMQRRYHMHTHVHSNNIIPVPLLACNHNYLPSRKGSGTPDARRFDWNLTCNCSPNRRPSCLPYHTQPATPYYSIRSARYCHHHRRPVCVVSVAASAATAATTSRHADAHTLAGPSNELSETTCNRPKGSAFLPQSTLSHRALPHSHPPLHLPVRRRIPFRVAPPPHDVTGGTHSRAGPSNGKSAPALSRPETVLVTRWPTPPHTERNASSDHGNVAS